MKKIVKVWDKIIELLEDNYHWFYIIFFIILYLIIDFKNLVGTLRTLGDSFEMFCNYIKAYFSIIYYYLLELI